MLSTSQPLRAGGLHHLIRYGAGSVLCAAVNNVILIASDLQGLSLFAGVLLSWLGGGVTGYVWHATVSFRSRPTLGSFVRFMGGALAGLPLAWIVLWLFHEVWAWPMWLAGPAATLVLFLYHYLNAFLAIHRGRIRSILSRK